MAADGYTIHVDQAGQFVAQFESANASAATVTGSLGSDAVSSSAFATIGGSVGAANDSMQSGTVDGLNRCTQLLGSTTLDVKAAIERYIAADTAVAQSYNGLSTAAAQTANSVAGKARPTKEKPLPPYNTAKPTVKDRALKADLTMALPYFTLKGWRNAEGMFSHYLYGNGEDYKIDPAKLMQDVPGFGQAVRSYVAGQQGKGSFQSGWINTNTDLTDAQGNVTGQQSMDWYYAMHDWRYQVTGSSVTTNGTTTTQYTVDVFKPYIFGSPRSDINVPMTRNLPGGPITLKQDDIQNLNTVGLARNFDITGTATLTYP